MRAVQPKIVIAKIQRQYWNAIARGEKTLEIRDEYIPAQYMVFTDLEGERVYGVCRVKGITTLSAGLVELPIGACCTVAQLAACYPHAVDEGCTVRPLYAYSVELLSCEAVFTRVMRESSGFLIPR
ncbi:hypothetical protein GCM10007377_15810 [Galliscardovia ingluviei]|uniref:ASCH domain-containing protein n=1 Tax=Galliscardovia ingluviei TaxID=1769422 RepID=A0A8J3AMD5_9BIFI|nr:ASCH domain-containing protein [Galliscardovia ingluviei]GGI15420.1 hypothetical protein GCM10007377_15810 [Galliscardovia ingluviei]